MDLLAQFGGGNELLKFLNNKELLIRSEEDRRYWPDSSSGDFSMKDAYEKFREKSPKQNCYKWIWSQLIQTKISVFNLKLWKNAIKLDVEIQHYGISLASKCVCFLISPKVEDVNHLFWVGEIVVETWKHF